MGFGNNNYCQYWMGRPDPSSNGWFACSKLVINKLGLDGLLESAGLEGYTIFQQFPTHNSPLYKWSSLYEKWVPIN